MMNIGPPLNERGEQPHRRESSRLRVRLPARLITLSAQQSGILLDLSLTGCRVQTSRQPFAVGTQVVLTWGPFEEFGEVVWTHQDISGIAFYDPLRPEALIATRELDDVDHVRVEREIARETARQWVEGTRRL